MVGPRFITPSSLLLRLLPRAALGLAALGFCVFTLVLRGSLLDTLSIHWDEFNFLNHVHRTIRGEESSLFLAFHGHLLRWIALLDGNEIDQILAGRWTMFILVLVHTGLLAWLGRRLLGSVGAGLFAAGLYGSFSFVLHHGASFRYDPLIVTLFLGAAALLVTGRRPWLTGSLAGLLGALGLLVSLKFVFYLPTLILIAAAPFTLPAERSRAARRFGAFAAAGVLGSGLLLLFHWSTLPPLDEGAGDKATRIAGKAFQLAKPFPRGRELMETLRWDTPMWLLVLLGFALVVGSAVYASPRRRRVSLACAGSLALPLVTLYFYRNAWPYFYVSVLPGGCLLAGALWRRAEATAVRHPIVALLAAAILTVPAGRTAWLWYEHNSGKDEIAIQREIVAAVHEVFPEPVPYLDRCGMIATFPKAGFFMSTWTMSAYRDRRQDIIADLLRDEQPKMVLANIRSLELNRSRGRGGYRWRPRDYRTLKANFVRHWGPIWVAGKEVRAGESPTKLSILIAGTYTLEASRPVLVDGQTRSPGDAIQLIRGDHVVQAAEEGPVKAVLRFGDHLARPSGRPPRGRLFRGFHSKKPRSKWDLWD